MGITLASLVIWALPGEPEATIDNGEHFKLPFEGGSHYGNSHKNYGIHPTFLQTAAIWFTFGINKHYN